MSAIAKKPDFLCIGAQKAGTRWLYDQLTHHPQFWMPPIKEFHFFDGRFVKRYRGNLPNARTVQAGGKCDGEGDASRDREFLRRAEAVLEKESGDFDDYRSMFEVAGDRFTGDITPAYSTLDEKQIRQIKRYLPHLKIVFSCRDPVSRFWSQLNQHIRAGKEDVPDPDDAPGIKKFLRKKNVDMRSFPTRSFRAWKKFYPDMKVIFFDDIRDRPDAPLAEVLGYLGADPGNPVEALSATFNRKSHDRKIEMKPHVERMLVDYFGDEMNRCAWELGGRACEWRDRY